MSANNPDNPDNAEPREARTSQNANAGGERRPYRKPAVSDFFQPSVVLGTVNPQINVC